MTSKKTTTARPTCGYPGRDQLAAPAEKPGQPPEYCAGRGHTRASAWKERRRLNAEKNGTTISAADDASPATMAKLGSAELLWSLRTKADQFRVEADAAEQMSEELTAAQDRASAAEQRAQAAQTSTSNPASPRTQASRKA
jgi:colicin import membrane protein